MSRDRDPFERTLDLLRRRLRMGAYGLGQPLHIQKLAGTMAVSSTPVREALARLSGEGLIARARSGYRTHRYDAAGLGDLYHLDQTYALATLTGRRGASRAPRPPAALAAQTQDESDYVARTERLLADLGQADNHALAAARQTLWDRLAPFRALEPLVLPDIGIQALERAATEDGPARGAALLVRAYYRARLRAVPALLGSALARKYPENIP